MARKYRLTWDRCNRRWKKIYKGRAYYFPLLPGETKASSYPRALAAWEKKKAENDGLARAEDQNSQKWQTIIDFLADRLAEIEARGDTADNRHKYIATQEQIAQARKKQRIGAVCGDVDDDLWLGTNEREDPSPWAIAQPALPVGDSIEEYARDFLAGKMAEATTNGKSLEWIRQLRIGIETLLEFAGRTKSVKSIDSHLMHRYRQFLIGKIASGEWTKKYASGRLNIAKQFVAIVFCFYRLS